MTRRSSAVLFILSMGMMMAWASPAAALTVRVDGVITRADGPLELGQPFHGLLRYDQTNRPQIVNGQYRVVDELATLRLVCGNIVLESTGGLTLTIEGGAAVSKLTVQAGAGWLVTDDQRVTQADLTIGFIPGVAAHPEGRLPDQAGFGRFWADGSSVTFAIDGDRPTQAVGDIHAAHVLPTPVGAAMTISLVVSAGAALLLGRRRK